MSMSQKQQDNPLLKLVLEMGPLVAFFAANSRPHWFKPFLDPFLSAAIIEGPRAGIFIATAVFMAAMSLSLILSRLLVGKLPIMPIVSGIVVLIFGALTLWLQDDTFIKLKPTIVNSLFGVILLGALAFGKPLLPIVLDSVFQLDHAGWKKLTLRWGLFFLVLAALNEIVWRGFSTDTWVAFKVWGVMPITMVFALAQTPLIMRHRLEEEA